MKKVKKVIILGVVLTAVIGWTVSKTTTQNVFVPEGPLSGGEITGAETVEVGETVTLTAIGSSDGRPIDKTILQPIENGGPEVRRQLTYFWSCDQGWFLDGTQTGTATWQAGAVEGTVNFQCIIEEGVISIGRPFPIVYDARMVTVTTTRVITAPKVDHIALTPESATITAGGSAMFQWQAYDKNSNPMLGVSYVLSTDIGTMSVGTTTPGTSGTLYVVATATTGILSIKAMGAVVEGTITVVPGSATYVFLSPGTATVPTNGTKMFTAQAADKFGNLILGLFAWEVVPAGSGTVVPPTGSTTVFAANDEPGTVCVVAEIEGSYATATITVYQPVLDVLTAIIVVPGSITRKAGSTETTSLVAKGKNQYDQEMTIPGTFTWELSSAELGTVIGTEATSNYTPGTKTGSGTLRVTNGGTITGIATITVTSTGEYAVLKVSPAMLEVHIGTSSSVGTTTQCSLRLRMEDKYGNLIERTGTWTAYSTLAGGVDGDVRVENPNIPHGSDEVEILFALNPKKYGWTSFLVAVEEK